MKKGDPWWAALFVVGWLLFCAYALTVNGIPLLGR